MELLPQEVRVNIPQLYVTEKETDPMVWVKFFTPWTGWTWYIIEFDGEDLFFGWFIGWDEEFGFFTLSELASVEGPAGLKVERDLYFEPCRLSEVLKRERGG